VCALYDRNVQASATALTLELDRDTGGLKSAAGRRVTVSCSALLACSSEDGPGSMGSMGYNGNRTASTAQDMVIQAHTNTHYVNLIMNPSAGFPKEHVLDFPGVWVPCRVVHKGTENHRLLQAFTLSPLLLFVAQLA
jgi:hypothetical protein